LKHRWCKVGKSGRYRSESFAPRENLGQPGAAPNGDESEDKASAGIESGQHESPERRVDSVSHSKVEKVLYAPIKPTGIRNLHAGFRSARLPR